MLIPWEDLELIWEHTVGSMPEEVQPGVESIQTSTPIEPVYAARCRLLELPAEVRNLVYQEVFKGAVVSYGQVGESNAVSIDHAATSDHRNILQTCRRCAQEAMPLYYQTVTLGLRSGLWSFEHLKDCLPVILGQHLKEMRFRGSARIQGFVDHCEYFPRLSCVTLEGLTVFHSANYSVIDNAELWDLLEGPGITLCELAVDVPGFRTGQLIDGLHIRAEVYLIIECAVCEECHETTNVCRSLILPC